MKTQRMTEIGILVAVAGVLELISTLIPFLHMPQGGSVGIGMLPIFIIAYKYGVRDGLMAGFVFGIINFILSGMVIHWGSIFFDYIFAYTVLGFAGVFKGKANGFVNGVLFGGLLRYIMHGFSGMLFFSEWAGPEGAFVYSFILYNLPYMFASIMLCLVIGSALNSREIY